MWDIEKINDHINDAVEENLHLDYKSADALGKTDGKKKEISKDVSSFANSDGGVIVYGVSEFDETAKNHLPEKIDPVNRLNYTKEWLEQVINTNISPKIDKLKITPIQVGAVEDNQAIYVVEIPKSNTAHQAKDKRYYKRFNFESVPMDDYEVKDIINRLSKTQPKLYFKFTPPKGILETPPYPPIFDVRVWIHNNGNKVIKYLDCFITGNADTSANIFEPHTDSEFEEHFSNIVEREVTIGENTFILSSERAVILPNTSRRIGVLRIRREFLIENNTIKFQISTEDNVKYYEYTGVEILQ